MNNDFVAQNLDTDVYSSGFAINNSSGIQVNKDTPKHDIVLAEFELCTCCCGIVLLFSGLAWGEGWIGRS